MQIGLFEIISDKIVPGETALSIPILAKVKKEYKEDYLKIFAYLFFMSCWDSRNTYLNVPEEERSQQILCDLNLDVSTEDDTMIKALEICQKLYETPAVRAMKSCKNMIDKLSDTMDTTTPIYGGKDANIDNIDKVMQKLPVYMDSYNKISEMLKEEQSKVRGGKKLAYDQLEQLKK